jgi:lon-related putative ATP-dependent protease
MSKELSYEEIRRTCEPNIITCPTTEELQPLEEIIGQERAVKAIKFGLEIEQFGFNIYVSGYPGSGRTTAVKDFLEEIAKTKAISSDWIYVNNFKDSYEPQAIRLPPGKAREFKDDVSNLISEAKVELPKAFESEEYASRRESTIKIVQDERNQLFSQLNTRAQKEGFVLQFGPTGIIIVPIIGGKPINQQEFMSLRPEVRDEIVKKREKLQAELRNAVRQLRALDRKTVDEIKNLNREVALYAIGHLITELKEKYEKIQDIITYLDDVQNDVIDNLNQFITPATPQNQTSPLNLPWMKEIPFKKYEVNIIVDNFELKGAPVVLELNPTYQNIFGRIEKQAQFGVLTTDFTMIRGGSLHKANGGYLVLPVEEILQNLFSWDSLKRALKNKEANLEEAGERLGFITTKGLRPEPIPLNIKVILIGHPFLYPILYSRDKDFKELFKVKADFDTSMDRTEENMLKYAAFICTFCRKENIHHLDGSGVAKVIEYGSRLANDQEKLSTSFADIADIIREACFYASQDKSDYVTDLHIKRAIEEKIYRSNLIQERIQEMINRRFLLIDTEDEVVGQVNGLSVLGVGDFSFGAPSRVTVSVGLGREGIVDIQREARLGGPIHTKGVMILSGYLAEKYSKDKPLSLSTRLVFEQSYGMVEGDSASSTELYAILSSLSGIPIKQTLAVTGSVNQKGDVQVIGGVNEKIEGFFEVCKARGFNRNQGVLIPEGNVKNLMLKEEVVEAVKEGKFHIYPIKTIDQGIEVLTGEKAGVTQLDGTYEEGSINYLVNKRLNEMAERMKEFSALIQK